MPLVVEKGMREVLLVVEESKREAVDMVDGIRSQFNTLLDEIDWMDPATKRKARY